MITLFSCTHMNNRTGKIYIIVEESSVLYSFDGQKYDLLKNIEHKNIPDNVEIYMPFKKISEDDILNQLIKDELLKYINNKKISYLYPLNSVNLNMLNSPSLRCGFDDITAHEIEEKLNNK